MECLFYAGRLLKVLYVISFHDSEECQKSIYEEQQQAHILTANKKAMLKTRSQILKAAHISRTKKVASEGRPYITSGIYITH